MKINPIEKISAGSFRELEEWEAPDPIVENDNTPEWDRKEENKSNSFELNARHREARPYPELVKAYNLFKDYFHPKDDVVYYPCCGDDVSPSSVFQKSRVVYVDFKDTSVEQTKGFEFHKASALEFNPGNVDILILQNPQISPEAPCSYVTDGGYVLSNDYHNTAFNINNNGNYKIKAVISRGKDNNLFLDTENLDDCWREIEDEEEFKNAPLSFNSVGYESALSVVLLATGKKENVLAEYKKIIAKARELEKIKADKFSSLHGDTLEDEPLDSDTNGFVSFNCGGQDLLLRVSLPRKRGSTDDTFVFQKIL